MTICTPWSDPARVNPQRIHVSSLIIITFWSCKEKRKREKKRVAVATHQPTWRGMVSCIMQHPYVLASFSFMSASHKSHWYHGNGRYHSPLYEAGWRDVHLSIVIIQQQRKQIMHACTHVLATKKIGVSNKEILNIISLELVSFNSHAQKVCTSDVVASHYVYYHPKEQRLKNPSYRIIPPTWIYSGKRPLSWNM